MTEPTNDELLRSATDLLRQTGIEAELKLTPRGPAVVVAGFYCEARFVEETGDIDYVTIRPKVCVI